MPEADEYECVMVVLFAGGGGERDATGGDDVREGAATQEAREAGAPLQTDGERQESAHQGAFRAAQRVNCRLLHASFYRGRRGIRKVLDVQTYQVCVGTKRSVTLKSVRCRLIC